MHKKIDANLVLSKAATFVKGERYNLHLDKDEAGYLLLDADTPSDEPIVVRSNGTEIYWDVADDYEPELYGRPFIHGKFDCYTFLRDYYKQHYAIELPEKVYEDVWWNNGGNYYMESAIPAGFEVVQPPLQVGDVIAMKVRAGVVNHTAIYLGDQRIAHHMGGEVSKEEVFRPAYLRWVFGYFRHKDLS